MIGLISKILFKLFRKEILHWTSSNPMNLLYPHINATTKLHKQQFYKYTTRKLNGFIYINRMFGLIDDKIICDLSIPDCKPVFVIETCNKLDQILFDGDNWWLADEVLHGTLCGRNYKLSLRDKSRMNLAIKQWLIVHNKI